MKKREYLQRLTIIMLLLLILPVVLFFISFRKYTSGKMEQNNEDFYEMALETYTSLMDKKIQELEMFAAKISAGSRESGSTLHAGGEALVENPYQLYMAVNELRENTAGMMSVSGEFIFTILTGSLHLNMLIRLIIFYINIQGSRERMRRVAIFFQ